MRDYQPELKSLIKGAGLSRQAVANLLWVSIHTLNSYLKPRGNASAHRVPPACVELLSLKTGQKLPGPLGEP